MPPDLLHAAAFGDYDEAEAVIKVDKGCISALTDFNQNALQVALINFREDICYLLLEETEISVRNKDGLGRDAFDLARMLASEDLALAIYDRWLDEYGQNNPEIDMDCFRMS